MMKNISFLMVLSFGLTLSSLAHAYKYSETNKAISSRNLLQEAERLGLGSPFEERLDKKTIRAWKAQTVRKHLDSIAPDPLLLEIQAGQQNLERAKILARLELYKGARKNWNQIKNTALNDVGAEHWFQFEDKLRRDLEKMEFSDTRDMRNFLFLTPWGHARVSKDLKQVSWAIEIGRHLDGNRLEDGVKDIVIPDTPHSALPAPTPIKE